MRKYLCVTAVLLASCATSYTELDASEPHATITFQRNAAGVKAVNNEPFQGYELIDNPRCENAQKVAWFSWDSEYIKTARIGADKKLHFFIHSVPNQNLNGPWCFSYLGFDAQNGRDYVVMHEACTPVVYDKTDGDWQAVTDIDVIDGFECPKS